MFIYRTNFEFVSCYTFFLLIHWPIKYIFLQTSSEKKEVMDRNRYILQFFFLLKMNTKTEMEINDNNLVNLVNFLLIKDVALYNRFI